MPEGKLQRNSGGKLQRNSSGKLIRNSSSSTDCCCTGCDYYRFRRCCDDVYVDFSMASTDVPQLPFTAIYTDTGAGGGDCWYINASSTCVAAIDYPVISIDDLQEYTDCADCYPECTDCISETTCGCCADDCTGNTPTDFTVTVSGVTLQAACSTELASCDAGDYYFKPSGTYTGGTYTLTQAAACQWTSATFSGPSVKIYSDSSCTTEIDEITYDYQVILSCVASAWTLVVVGVENETPDPGCGFAYLFANTAFNLEDCCSQNTDSSDFVTTGVLYDGNLQIGSGGTAALTPC